MDKTGEMFRKKVKEKPFLPDEIITNILIRLPVKSLVRFELVCRKWREIILGPDFVDSHNTSSIPVILVGTTPRNRTILSDLFAVDKWWDLSRTRSTIHRFPFRAVDFPDTCLRLISHAGLIVLESVRWEPNFIILNPARPGNEFVKIHFSRVRPVDILAVYYHPSLREYISLLKIDKYNPITKPVQYKLLILSSKPSSRSIRNSFNYAITSYARVFLNDHVYWTLKSEIGRNDILEFNILSEEFKVIPCPIPLNTECKRHQTQILNIDGVISSVLILPSKITIWRLEDRVQELWTSIEYTICLESYHIYSLDLIAVVEGKLAFKYGGRLFVCDLVEGTVKKYPKKYTGYLMSHQMTLSSLKNCKDDLYIDDYGNLVV